MNIPPAPLNLLHEQLEAKSLAQRAASVYYHTVDSPVGGLLLAATKVGVVRVAFEQEGDDAVLQSLAERISPKVLRAPKALDPAVRWLERYFLGKSTGELPLDLRLTGGYRAEVLSHLREVPYGQRISYAALAAQTSSPRAVRAVGTACATNPLPLLIPCHRVVRSDGALGNYLGGLDAKRRLLALEVTGSLPD